MKIVIVDDMADTRLLLKFHLSRMGYLDVVQFASGYEALEALSSPPPGQVFDADLILMDLYMPGLSGIDACRAFKSVPHLADIPLIIVTAEASPEELGRAFEAGAVDYITKPLIPVILKARVQSALRLKHEMDRRKVREQELLEMSITLEAMNQSLLHLATCDALTGIPNRRVFDERLELEWQRARRSGEALSIIMIDVDEFKVYNDCYGHPRGDECLRQVAQTIAQVVRSTDLLARYGGEEFAAILPMTGIEPALIVAERLRSAVVNLALPHKQAMEGFVTISLGIAGGLLGDFHSAQDLIGLSDQGLYRAKRTGRNRVALGPVGDGT